MSTDKTPGTPSGWKTPGDVMKLHRLRIKQKALNARLTGGSMGSQSSSKLPPRTSSEKTVNPFRKYGSNSNLPTLSQKRTIADVEDEEANDEGGALFQLLNVKNKNTENVENISSFENILSKISNPVQTVSKEPSVQGHVRVPIDWTLRSKMRFMSRKPFAWNQKLKTCEEASGITGFVRCLDNDSPFDNVGGSGSGSQSASTLDTSPSAQFLSTCLYWTHPHLPWLQLFPRSRLKPPTATSAPGGNALNAAVPSSSVLTPDMRAALHRDWIKSFMSLFHLLRAKQCPYFYLVSNSFTCLFRAAGISGITELHAILTPTTRGFRHLLRAEDIEFTMPLKKTSETSSSSVPSAKKTSCSSLDPTLEPLEQTQMETFSDEERENEDMEEVRTEDWLKEMGVASHDIRRIQNTQCDMIMGEEREIDRTPESLVYVEGTEAQALFNFLVNCKSCVATTGYLTGVPPTLISPVCFHSASLQYLQVKDSTVKLEGDVYYSMEVRGPILPHTIQYLCSLLEKSQDSFSLTFASVESTKPFSQIKSEITRDQTPSSSQCKEGTPSLLASPRRNACSSIFEQQNLSDCGLRRSLISEFCSDKSLKSYESVKYSGKMYKIM